MAATLSGAARVPATCPIDGQTRGSHGHSRTLAAPITCADTGHSPRSLSLPSRASPTSLHDDLGRIHRFKTKLLRVAPVTVSFGTYGPLWTYRTPIDYCPSPRIAHLSGGPDATTTG